MPLVVKIPGNSTKKIVAFALTRQTWRYTVMPLVVKIPGKSTKKVAFALTRQTWRYTVMPLVIKIPGNSTTKNSSFCSHKTNMALYSYASSC